MVDRLTNLIAIFENQALDFSKNRADGDDILGDAYEYLMRHFATESGKSKGQFYTPAEVSRDHGARSSASATPRPAPPPPSTIPTCGSGSLLLKVGDEAGTPGHALRPGEGRRHQRPRPHEHDPAQQPHRAHRAGQHADRSQVQGRRHPQDLRLRRRQSAVLRQALEHRPRSAARPLRALQALRHAARQAGRLRLPAAHRPLAQEHRQGRVHPAARRAVPRQCRGRHPPEPRPQGLHQGHHRPARQPVLRHRHPRLHRRHRQGGRPRPQGHLHDRRQRRLHEGRPQEPPARPGHPQDRGRVQQAARTSRDTRAWSASRRSRRTTSTSTCRATSTARQPEDMQDIEGHLQGRHPRRRRRRARALLGRLPAAADSACSRPNRPGYARPRRGEVGHQVRHLRASRVRGFHRRA